jgi:hypothetical protein
MNAGTAIPAFIQQIGACALLPEVDRTNTKIQTVHHIREQAQALRNLLFFLSHWATSLVIYGPVYRERKKTKKCAYADSDPRLHAHSLCKFLSFSFFLLAAALEIIYGARLRRRKKSGKRNFLAMTTISTQIIKERRL